MPNKRVPIPGQDKGNWGTILNEHLNQTINSDFGGINYWTTAQRPTGLTADDKGRTGVNTDTSFIEVWSGTEWTNISKPVITLQNITELKNFPTPTNDQNINVLGYESVGDGGGGLFKFDSTSTSADNGGTVFASSNVSVNGRWIRLYDKGTVNVKWYGAKGNGTGNDQPAIQAAIDSRSNDDGVIFIPRGNYNLGSMVTLTTNMTLTGESGTRLTATAPMTSVVFLGLDTSQVTVENIEVDANNQSSFHTIYSDGGKNVTIKNCRVLRWRYGIGVFSSTNRAASDVNISYNEIIEPGTPAIVPLGVQSRTGGFLISRVMVDGNKVVGNLGAYSPTNDKTADQYTLHGCRDFHLINNLSINGGENGMSITRLSANGIISKNIVKNNDGHGIQVGAAFIKIVVNNINGAVNGDTLTVVTSPENGSAINTKGEVQAIDGNTLFMNKTTVNTPGNGVRGGSFSVGDVLSNGSTVTEVERCHDIIVSDNISTDNGINANNNTYQLDNNDVVAVPYSGLFFQQTDNLSVNGNISYDSSPNTLKQGYGISGGHAKNITIGINEVSRNIFPATNIFGFTSYKTISLPGLIDAKKFSTSTTAAREIISGEITSSGSYHRLFEEGFVAGAPNSSPVVTDNLTTITAESDGQRLVLRTSAGFRHITIKHGTGNIRLAGGIDFILDNIYKTIELMYVTGGSSWVEISRSDNG